MKTTSDIERRFAIGWRNFGFLTYANDYKAFDTFAQASAYLDTILQKPCYRFKRPRVIVITPQGTPVRFATARD